jgi:hypothetical protein
LYGRWQEGIEPAIGLSEKDRDQFHRLEDLIHKYRGSGAFTIPMDTGLSDDQADLDRTSFSEWLHSRGMDSRILNWYMNYCCRDDYGALASETSAWAGVHYFAAREPEEKGPLTWPEGNGWIVRRLLERVGEFVRSGQMVHGITRRGQRFSVVAGTTEYQAEVVIFAAPPTGVAAGLVVHLEQHEVAEPSLVKTPGCAQPGDAAAHNHDRVFFHCPGRRKRRSVAQLVTELEGVVHEATRDRPVALAGKPNQRCAAGHEELPARYLQWLMSFQSWS